MLLNLGIIAESPKSVTSLVVFVPKDDGKSWRLCTNFRKANNPCVADPFPLPRVEELLDRIGTAKFLTKIDLTKGCWQEPMKAVLVPITGFCDAIWPF
jgi:hypothetical protein